jgi:hypothetical protein
MMPTYTVIDTKKDKEYEVICSWDELQHILSASPELKQGLSTPMSVSMTGNTVSKTSGDWRDYLKKVKKESGKGNSINI